MNVKNCKEGAVTVRLRPGTEGALGASRARLSENSIVRHALRAAVNAIETNDYKIELPLEIALAKAPIESHVRGAPNAAVTCFTISIVVRTSSGSARRSGSPTDARKYEQRHEEE
jgi:hypothetical protein